MPMVSVIIPTHNRADYLKAAIASVMDQKYKDYEVIVIDDHSTDNTYDVVNGFEDQRIHYISNKGRNGPSIARNVGIAAARGKYVAFLDDDDWWFPLKLEKQIKVMDGAAKNVCGVYSNRLRIDKVSGKIFSDSPEVKTLRGNILSQLIIKSPIHTSTLLIRKKCLDEVGSFDENMRYMEDLDMWIRLAIKWEFEYIDAHLIKAYFHGNDHLSTNLEGQTQGREILIKRYQHLFKKNKKSWSELYVCLGAQYCQLKKMNKGRMNLLKGIWLYPFNKIAFFHFFSSLSGASNYQRIRRYYKNAQFS